MVKNIVMIKIHSTNHMCNKYLILVLWFQILASSAFALTSQIKLSEGHDSNVNQTQEKESSFFTLFQSQITHLFLANNPHFQFDVMVNGFYQDYADVEDKYSVLGNMAFYFPIADGRIMPGAIVGCESYRDDQMIEDEYNRMMMGVNVSWILHDRLTFDFTYTMNRLKYLEPEINTFDSQQHQQHQKYQPTLPPIVIQNQNSMIFTNDRNDTIHSISSQATVYAPYDIELGLGFSFNYCDSSIESESYKENEWMASLSWLFLAQWQMDSTIFLRNYYYQSVDEIIKPKKFQPVLNSLNPMMQSETSYQIQFTIRRQISWGDIFVGFEWSDSHSEPDIYSYQRQVIQCGVHLSF